MAPTCFDCACTWIINTDGEHSVVGKRPARWRYRSIRVDYVNSST